MVVEAAIVRKRRKVSRKFGETRVLERSFGPRDRIKKQMAAEEAKKPDDYSNLPYAVLFAKRLVEVIKKVTDPDEIQVTWKITKLDAPVELATTLVSAHNPDLWWKWMWKGPFPTHTQSVAFGIVEWHYSDAFRPLAQHALLQSIWGTASSNFDADAWLIVSCFLIAAELRTRHVV
jgi:hypothetical protein